MLRDINAEAPPSTRGLLASFEIQCRVIGALIMRELHTRYGRENVGYLWMILEPMTLAAAVASLHSGERTHYGTDVRGVPFAIIGYTIFIIFRGIFTRAEATIESNRPLLYHRMVTLLDMLIARALLEGASVGMTLVILLGLAIAFGLADLPVRPLWLIFAVGMMVAFSFAASLVCSAVTHDNRTVARLIHPATYILMPLSGGFYMLAWVPEPYRTYISYIPLVHIFEMARYGQFEDSSLQYVDLPYLISWILVTLLIGLLGVRIVRRHIHLN